MRTVSVSDLSLFVRYAQGGAGDLDTLLAQLRRETPPTREMEAGRAFHKILEELPADTQLAGAEQDGFKFHFFVPMQIAAPTEREVSRTKSYFVRGDEIVLSGRADVIANGTVYDHKLTQYIDPDRYTDSYQWRAYLDIFAAKRFVYNCFEYRYLRQEDVFEVMSLEHIECFWYKDVAADLTRWLSDFSEFADRHEL